MNQEIETYNSIPVYYCRHCLSLKIKGDTGFEYCDQCGSTDVDSCNINYWETLYKDKHGYNYLNKK